MRGRDGWRIDEARVIYISRLWIYFCVEQVAQVAQAPEVEKGRPCVRADKYRKHRGRKGWKACGRNGDIKRERMAEENSNFELTTRFATSVVLFGCGRVM
jgi:hypothetical protein